MNLFNIEENQEIDQCCICLCEMDDNNKLHKLDCGHKFHTDCIIEVFRTTKNNENGLCPLCRQKPKPCCKVHIRARYSKFKLICNYVKKNKVSDDIVKTKRN